MSDNLDFKTKSVKRDKEGHSIIIKGSNKKENIIIVNIFAPNMETSKYIKQLITNIKVVIDSKRITAGDFNTPFTSMNRSSKQKINKETVALNHTLD